MSTSVSHNKVHAAPYNILTKKKRISIVEPHGFTPVTHPSGFVGAKPPEAYPCIKLYGDTLRASIHGFI